jgi:glycosyltransferase involved in cell wall biosynthesis
VRVGINALHLVPGETGGLEIYARRLLPELAALDPGLDITVFASREGAESLRAPNYGVRVIEIPVNARSRPRRVLAEQTLLPAHARRAGTQLLHNLFNTAPLVPGVPQVTTVHDLIYLHDPAPTILTRGQALLVPLGARRSRRVITVSHASERDIVEHAGVAPERIDVVPNGPGMEAPTHPREPAEVRREFGAEARPLVLTVSAKLPHKNLPRLIEAMGRVGGDPTPVLVVPGYATAAEDPLREQAARSGAEVRFAGWLDDATLDALYRAADVFVLPSLTEGFGLPVLEAMLRGTPVACSGTTSLPEVGGDAALYFDPTDVDAIAAAVRRLIADEGESARLVDAGYLQAARFDWRQAAQLTLASYRRALGD